MRQVLPVVKLGSRAMIVDACINNSNFWPSVQRLGLTVNKQAELLQGDPTLHYLAAGRNMWDNFLHNCF